MLRRLTLATAIAAAFAAPSWAEDAPLATKTDLISG